MAPIESKNRNLNVFLFYPLDEKRKPVTRAVIFTVYDCGFVARSTEEVIPPGTPWQEKLRERLEELLKESRYGIFDLSEHEKWGRDERTSLKKDYIWGDFTGPFKSFYNDKLFSKRNEMQSCLIFDEHMYGHNRFFWGQDVSSYSGSPRRAVVMVRNWLGQFTDEVIPSGETIWKNYEKFSSKLPDMCKKLGLDIKELDYRNYAELVSGWLLEYSRLRQKSEG